MKKKTNKKRTNVIAAIAHKLSLTKLMTFGCDSGVPERSIAVGYLVYILLGWLVLCLPWCHTESCDATMIDHLFTAASALSTTGLATVDVPAVYSTFGMVVILLLIQGGALGYMTITSFLMLHITNKISERSNKVMKAAIAAPFGMDLKTLIDNVVKFTFAFEAIGFAALWITFGCLDVESAAWNALFISISSFCTAGISTFSDSLCSFSGNFAVNIIVAILSYSGAMGFIVMTDMRMKLTNRNYRITFTTRVILTITFWMTVLGIVFLMLFPAHTMSGNIPVRFLEAFFQTMTAMTTVGFNTFDLAALPAVSVLVLSMIMFIGASPSGTGGGLKSTTLSAGYAFVVSMLRGRKEVTLRGNKLPFYRINSALVTILVYGFVLLAGVLALVAFDSSFTFSQLLFEAASALGTVGISLGITSQLSIVGKFVLIALMYIGRVGVITLSAALMSHELGNSSPRKADIAV